MTDLCLYHRKRRQLAQRLGICIQCNSDPAEEGRTKCRGCIQANAAARERKQRMPHGGLFQTRFTPEQIADIHRRRRAGESESSIATVHGCAQSTVHRILSNPATIAA